MAGGPATEPYAVEPFEVEAELVGVDDRAGGRYDVRPVHPIGQLAMRVGLWSAVAIGAVGGIFGLVRPPVQQVEAVAQDGEDVSLPAPVAGVAELVVDAWLTASDEDDPALDALFVNPPSTTDLRAGDLVVERLTTVSGEERATGYWAVTVAADVVETLPVELGSTPEEEAEPETLASRWYLEVAIVGDVGGGLAALTTPAVMPGPPEVATDWAATAEPVRSPGEGTLELTVEGFLGALLADGGDPVRYMAPGVEIDTLESAPFLGVDLVGISSDELDDGKTRVLAEVTATSRGGTRTLLTYELLLTEWSDRWEIASFSGAPSMVVGPVPGEEPAEEPAEESDEAPADEPADEPAADPAGSD